MEVSTAVSQFVLPDYLERRNFCGVVLFYVFFGCPVGRRY